MDAADQDDKWLYDGSYSYKHMLTPISKFVMICMIFPQKVGPGGGGGEHIHIYKYIYIYNLQIYI